MNVASLENCKELFELSGWTDVDLSGWTKDEYPEHNKGTFVSTSPIYGKSFTYLCPAYDLGYLLRKLPSGYQLNLDTTMSGSRIYWFENFAGDGAPQQTSTPEDAAAKLAIELFKQNILRPEGKE